MLDWTCCGWCSTPHTTTTTTDLAGVVVNRSLPFIASIPLESLHLRFAVLKMFNQRLARCIEMIDTTNTDNNYSVGYYLRQLGHVVFGDTRGRLVEAAIERTWQPGYMAGLSLLVVCVKLLL